MTEPDEPEAEASEAEDVERLQLSVAQIAASSLAAVTAAVICSLFGVAGTVIGTAAASIVATVGSALYAHSMRRTKARLRRLHKAGATSPPITEVIKTARESGRRMLGQMPVRVVAVGAVIVFVVSAVTLTAIEAGIGKPLSAVFGVGHSGGRTTSFGSVGHVGGRRHKSSPKPTDSSTPSATATPTATVTATVTATATPTPTPRPSSTVTPTVSPSVSQTASTKRTPRHH